MSSSYSTVLLVFTVRYKYQSINIATVDQDLKFKKCMHIYIHHFLHVKHIFLKLPHGQQTFKEKWKSNTMSSLNWRYLETRKCTRLTSIQCTQLGHILNIVLCMSVNNNPLESLSEVFLLVRRKTNKMQKINHFISVKTVK